MPLLRRSDRMRFGLISRGIRFTSVALAAAVAGSVVPMGGCMRGQSGAMYFATQGSGIAKSEPRDVKPFRRIRLDGAAKIRVTIGQPQQLTISGDDNILPLIDTTVDNEELRISSHESYSSKTPLEVTITVA